MAYVIYTSGSTGRPKGVAVSHRALVSVLCAARVHLVTTEESAWHATASFSFDISVFEIFMCLTSGARVDIASGPWAEVREDVTHIQATPSHLRGLLKSGNLGRSGTRRTVLAGGEQLPLDLVSQLMERAAVRVLNLYGPAEATIWASIFDVSGLTDRRVPIGRPLSNTSLYVMDDKCSRVAAGVSGEICIGGHGVAWGYLGNAMQTADRFVPDPFSDRPGARMYRTGDNGRFRSDGVLEFLGRSDGQVKVDGQRIELGEVENALNEHPDVSASAAAVREVQPGDRRLVAFVTTHSGVDESAGAMLRAFLSGLLPQGLIPSTIHVVPELPLNVNGKIDRAALLSLPTGDPQRVAGRMPEGEIERAVARIWSEVLGTDAVPADCNFFDLGGTSLRLAEVFARLDETFPGRLTLLDLFASTTVGEVAAHLGSSHESAIPEVFVV